MGHEGQELWLKDALVFLVTAGLVVPLLRLGRVPAVLGFLLAGLVAGPYGLGRFADDVPLLAIVTIADPKAAEPFAELGILFLLFVIGLDLSVERLWLLRKVAFGAGSAQALGSAAAIAAAGMAIGIAAPAAWTIGLALALSSTAIVMQVLEDGRRAASPAGRDALAVLLFQDILVAPILIFVGFLSADRTASLLSGLGLAVLQGAAAILAIVLVGRHLMRGAFGLAARTGGRDLLMAITLLTAVGGAVMTAAAGLSFALGAFLAGLMLSETEFRHQAGVDLEPFKGLLLGVFFVTIGMKVDPVVILDELPFIVLALVGLLATKFAIAFAALRLSTGAAARSVEVAALIAPSGEFAFVVVAAAVAGGVLEPALAALVIAVAGLSMFLTPLLARLGILAADRLTVVPEQGEMEDFSTQTGHVVIAGFGRVGRTIARVLQAEEADVVALERDAALVRRERGAGWRVFLGDAARAEILLRAGARQAMMFVVTVDSPEDAEAMVRAVRGLRPDAPILVRARDADHADRLRAAGASFVIPDAIEAGLQLAERALGEFGHSGETIRTRIASERDIAYRYAGSV